MYSFAADARTTPGVSLFPKTIGLSIDPEEITTCFALIYQSLCLGVNSSDFGKWSVTLSDITNIL